MRKTRKLGDMTIYEICRRGARKTQAAIAAETGKRASTVGAWEQRIANPDLRDLHRIAAAYEVDPDQFAAVAAAEAAGKSIWNYDLPNEIIQRTGALRVPKSKT